MYRHFCLLVVLMYLVGCSQKPVDTPPQTSTPVPTPLASPNDVAPSPGPAKQNEPPAFRGTAEQFITEFHKDQDSARKKYGNKVIEVTGPFNHLASSKADKDSVVLVLRGCKAPDRMSYDNIVCLLPSEQLKTDPRLLSFARGQTITVRGRAHDWSLDQLEKGEIVSVGPSTAIPTTLREIESALETKDGQLRFEGKDVLLRVQLTGSKPSGDVAGWWRLIPPTDSNKRFDLEFPFMNGAHFKRLLEPNPGDTILVLAQVEGVSGDKIRLGEARRLDAVPEGLKLPEEKSR